MSNFHFHDRVPLSPTEKGREHDQHLPNVNSETAKLASPRKLSISELGCLFVDIGLILHSVHIAVKLSLPRKLGYGDLDSKVHLVQYQLMFSYGGPMLSSPRKLGSDNIGPP